MSTKAANGLPAIQHHGPGLLSFWGQDWDFANSVCELREERSDPKWSLDEQHCKWLKQRDYRFGRKVQHA